jgi:NAD-dependent DNA ligase
MDYEKDKQLIYRYNYPLLVKKAIQELIGIAGMIIYDGKIDDNEISFLTQWLGNNKAFLMNYPLSDLNGIINHILKDGTVTEQEKRTLFAFLDSISTTGPNRIVDNIFTQNCEIIFGSRNFTFTGDMAWGERQKAEKAVTDRGGSCLRSCTLKTNYLVVGDLGSEAYKYGRFGSKIETALRYKDKKKAPIQIVRENNFVEAVVKTNPVR